VRSSHQRRTVPLEEARDLAAPQPTHEARACGGAVDQAIRDAVREVVREELNTIIGRLGRQGGPPSPAERVSEYLSIGEGAELVNVHPATLRTWIKDGRLIGHRAGRHHRIKRSELESFMTQLGGAPSLDLDRRARELSAA